MTNIQYISDANGQPIGVIVPIEIWKEIETEERMPRTSKLKSLFKKTQSLKQIKKISEEDISREIEAYREGR